MKLNRQQEIEIFENYYNPLMEKITMVQIAKTHRISSSQVNSTLKWMREDITKQFKYFFNEEKDKIDKEISRIELENNIIIKISLGSGISTASIRNVLELEKEL